MNGSTAHWRAWGQHLAIAGAYAASYELTRHVTFSHWILTAGLRLACLLLMPFRYWPALALGEAFPMAENAVLCLPQFGGAWAVSASVPMIVLCMALVKPMRERWALYGPDGRVRMSVVLVATLGCAVLTAAKTIVTLATALLASPDAWHDISVPTYFWAYLLGAYLGALTLTPIILAMHERSQAHRQITFALVRQSPLFRDTMMWALPILTGLACFALVTHDDVARELARLAMLLPVLGLAVRHGWHGTAVGGMGASIALAASGTVLLDPAMIRSQVILAAFISAALLVGARAPRFAGQGALRASPDR
ncbi:MAG TPA: hypothetical protein VN813_12460 [Luteibacter sp.]|nr:hypothetical protein [Luteibacter sp.]